jgi:hypothetical protein
VLAEDASTVRTGTAPYAMATIGNLVITAFRITGWTSPAKPDATTPTTRTAAPT